MFSSGVVIGPAAGSSCMPQISVSVSYVDLLLPQLKNAGNIFFSFPFNDA
jgi:hypothetical protein